MTTSRASPRDRAQDLDLLLVGDSERCARARSAGSSSSASSTSCGVAAAQRAPRRTSPSRAALDAEEDVLEDRAVRDERRLLGDDRHAVARAHPAASGSRRVARRPAARPSSGRCTPATILPSVDLPAPFSPTRPWIVPRCDRRGRRPAARARRRSACDAARSSTCGGDVSACRRGARSRRHSDRLRQARVRDDRAVRP